MALPFFSADSFNTTSTTARVKQSQAQPQNGNGTINPFGGFQKDPSALVENFATNENAHQPDRSDISSEAREGGNGHHEIDLGWLAAPALGTQQLLDNTKKEARHNDLIERTAHNRR